MKNLGVTLYKSQDPNRRFYNSHHYCRFVIVWTLANTCQIKRNNADLNGKPIKIAHRQSEDEQWSTINLGVILLPTLAFNFRRICMLKYFNFSVVYHLFN